MAKTTKIIILKKDTEYLQLYVKLVFYIVHILQVLLCLGKSEL